MHRHALLPLLFVAFSSFGQSSDPANYTRVLIPVFYTGPGAFGSFWKTTVTASNRSDRPISAARPVFGGDRQFTGDCIPTLAVAAFSSEYLCDATLAPSGLIVYVPKTASRDDLQWDARIRDLSRQADSAGTQLPVVREDQFFFSGMELLHIAAGANFRSAVRVYSYQKRAQVALEIYDEHGNQQALVELELQSPGQTPAIHFRRILSSR